MKTALLFVGLALLLPATLQAQSAAPRAEIFGGYSFLATDASLRNNMPKGWIGSFAYNLGRNIGIEADISGHYGHFGPITPFDDSNYLYQFGPRVAARLHRLTPWGHVLLGASQSRIQGSRTTKTNFAWAFGGGLDVAIHKNVTLRVAQADYVRMKIATLTVIPSNPSALGILPVPSNNLCLSFGAVFTFGGGH